MNDEMTFSMSLPLDSDGFLRRECPTCAREFKWLHAEEEEEATPAPEGGYYCPYCAVQAPPDAWWTKDQAEEATRVVANEGMPQILEQFHEGMEKATRGSKNLTYKRGSGKLDVPEPREDATEADDMKRVDFRCHPEDPIKVLDGWDGAVHCLICGTVA
jgi:hypothetical protein